MLLADAAPPFLSSQATGLVVGAMFTLAIGLVLALINREINRSNDLEKRVQALELARARAEGRSEVTTPNRRR